MRIICLVGAIGAGKSTFARYLVDDDPMGHTRILSTSRLLDGNNRLDKQTHGDRLDAETGGAWVRDAILPVTKSGGEKCVVVVDCVRRKSQIAAIRKRWPDIVIVIGIKTRVLEEHLHTRELDVGAMREIATAMEHPVEKSLPLDEADIIIDNTRYRSGDLLHMIAHRPAR